MTSEPRTRKARLFLGVRLSMDAIRALGELAESLRQAAYDAGFQVRWVAPANYHITLKFLGVTDPEIATALRDRLEPRIREVPRFEFSVSHMGAFPAPENARVLWAGVDDPSAGLTRLAEIIEREVAELGFPPEKRAYHPHVTLGRVKRVDDLSSLVRPLSEQVFRGVRADSVILFESIMKSTGSEYVDRARFGLSPAPGGEKRQTEPLKRSTTKAAESESEGSPATRPMGAETTREPAAGGQAESPEPDHNAKPDPGGQEPQKE